MWSVEVGIQRRTEGHRELDFAVAVAVAAAADPISEFLISSAIFEQRIRAGFIKIRKAFTITKILQIRLFIGPVHALRDLYTKKMKNESETNYWVLQTFLEVWN